MLIDPDFFDHWRTLMLIQLLNDELAPIYVMRLWAHAQTRKSDRFSMPARGLAAQCRYKGQDADLLERCMTESGFIARDGSTIIVCGWAEKNAGLLASWENGAKGGRKPRTQKKPTGFKSGTQTEPTGNPDLTCAEPIRLDKTRSDKKVVFTAETKTNTPEAGVDLPEQAKHPAKAPKSGRTSVCGGQTETYTLGAPVGLNAILENLGEGGAVLRDKFGSPSFGVAWEQWRRHRLSINKPLGDVETERQLAELNRFAADEAQEVIEFSILCGARNLIMNGDHKKNQQQQKEEFRW